MDDCKVLGIDGFNVFFFKKFWDIIYIDVCDVVKEIFYNKKMLKVINFMYIILIFKDYNFDIIRDYGFIVCCIMFYKIICKIIISILNKVFGDIVSDS